MGQPFIGRDREQAEFLAGLRDAIGGRGTLFLVAGEPGIGKTALAQRVADHAAEHGARVVWSRSWEGGTPSPYWTWVQVIRSLVEDLDHETLRSILPPEVAARLALLVPELEQRLGRAPAPIPGPDSDAGRFYLFDATSRFLRGVSSHDPLVLVLDDLLAGDRPSLLLLRFMARDVRTSRLLVVATYRDIEARSSPEAVDVIADVVREGHVLALRGLDREEVGRLVADLSGTKPWESKVAAIHETTQGNPLFVREITGLLGVEDRLDRPGRLAIPVPDSVRAVIRRRLAPLSADTVRMLSAAAVVGRDFNLALVESASDLAAERVLASLSEAVARGIVCDVPETIGDYRFTHPLMREVVYEGLPLPARMQMHRRVGEAIERLHDPDPTAHVGALAHHFAQAASIGEGDKAAEYARKAGDRAMDSYAYEEAAVQYRRALEALRFAGLDEHLRCELLLRLGAAHVRAADYGDAKESFARAAEVARRLHAPEELARAALGFGEPQVEGGLVDHQLIALLQEALKELSPDDSALRARVMARFSLELTFSDDAMLRESLSQEALEMARRLADVGARALACRARWMAVWGPDGLKERAALSEELLGLAEEAGDRELELVGRARRITCSLESGDIPAVDTDIAAHARAVEELRMPYHEWTVTSLRAGRALLDGSLEVAEELAEKARALLPGRPNAQQAYLNQISALRWEQGRLGELREHWHELVEQFPQAAFAWGWLSLAEDERGRHGEARKALSYLIEELPGLPRNGLWLPALAAASLSAARLHDGGAAACVYPLLLPYADLTISISMPHPVMCFGSASLYLGVLATETSQWEEAGDHFDAAMHANTRLGATAFLARTEYEYARMLIARGRTADRKRALALLDRAEAAAQSIGMVSVDLGCARLRALETGAVVPAREAAPMVVPNGGRNVFRREGDYWTIVYEGALVRLRDSKGLRHLARLLAEPEREFHAVDLEAAEAGGTPPPRFGKRSRTDELETRADLGDAGELLDSRAKAEYKARIEELRAELEEAERFNDPARAAKLEEEIDFIASELARAVGLGGRDRRAASHAERARLNVTRAIRAAMANLAQANASLGHHLSSTIRTGRYCSYTPDPRADTAWDL